MQDRSPSMLRSAMIGGAVLGAAGGMPLVGALNCCCVLFLGAGIFAAYLYSKECERQNAEFRPGNGATLGLIASPFYALATSVVAGVFRLIFSGGDEMAQITDALDQSGAPPEVADTILKVLEAFSGPLGWIFSFFVVLVFAAIFCTIGGLIGGALFKVKPPVQPSIDVPPPSAFTP